LVVRLPDSAQTSQPWRIHELVPDFELEDVWALPTPGGPHDFPRLVALMTSFDPESVSPVVRALFAIRWKIGALLGWDGDAAGVGARVSPLRTRVPAELRGGPDAPPFKALYMTRDEWAAEIANRTMHGVLHVGWVPDAAGGYRGQMAVYVKRNGLLGGIYMLAIRPFRHLLVYPQMLRGLEGAWASGAGPRASPRSGG
jgi:hypothetical protein